MQKSKIEVKKGAREEYRKILACGRRRKEYNFGDEGGYDFRIRI